MKTIQTRLHNLVTGQPPKMFVECCTSDTKKTKLATIVNVIQKKQWQECMWHFTMKTEIADVDSPWQMGWE